MLTAKRDPLAGVENIVQLPNAGRAQASPTLQTARAQPMPPVLFASWIAVRDRAAATLLGGTKRLLLTGPAGTGKTVLIEHVARVLRAAGRTVTIQLADADPAPPGPGETLFVDEADRLSAPKLRQLLDGAAGTVVLTGLAPLTRRVASGTVQLTLEPLGQEQAQDYIAKWLLLNGRTPAELDSKAVRALVEFSGGVPRLLATLLAAGSWLAKGNGAPIIGAGHIQEAAELRSVLAQPTAPDVADPGVEPRRRGRIIWWGLLGVLVLAGAAVVVAPRLFHAETGPSIARSERTAPPPALPAPRAVVSQPIVPATPVEPAPVADVPAAPEPESAAELPRAEPAPAPDPVQAEAAAPAPPIPPPIVAPYLTLPAETIQLLLRRGREMLGIDDLSAARLLFRRAAEGGSAEAMFDLGQTYDPAVQTGFGAAGQSDRAEALRWYRRAAEQGNVAAEKLLPKP